MTDRPLTGPASAYPTLRRPASICLREPNDVFVPGLIGGTLAGFALPDCGSAEAIIPSWAAAMLMATVPKKRRRSYLISSDIFLPPIKFRGETPSFVTLVAIDEIVITSFLLLFSLLFSLFCGSIVARRYYRSERLAPTCQFFQVTGISDSQGRSPNQR